MSTIEIPKEELVPIGTLKVDGDNPNQMTPRQHQALRKSIMKYGFIIPIITNKDFLIADGEQRLIIARELGMSHVKVVKLPVEDVDRRLLRQVLNKLRGEHELIADAHEFQRIIDAGGEDELKQLLLLNDNALERYLQEINEPKEENYEIPEIDKIQTDIMKGQMFQLGKHKLMCGDANSKEDLAKLITEEIPLGFHDPPYGINIVSTKGKVAPDGEYAKSGVYRPFLGDNKPFNPEHLLKLTKNTIIWGANHFASKLPDSSAWLVWSKKSPETKIYPILSSCELAWSNFSKPAHVYYCVWLGSYRQGEPQTKRKHPTQKPIKLYSDILMDYSEENNIILDLYGGSGTTLIACEQTGRRCFMMEIDPRYCQVIIDRWEAYTGKKASLIKND